MEHVTDRHQPITLIELAQKIPTRPHINSVRRWSKKGIRGVRLRTWRIGGRTCSSIAAWDEFVAESNPTASPISSTHLEAERTLERMGI